MEESQWCLKNIVFIVWKSVYSRFTIRLCFSSKFFTWKSFYEQFSVFAAFCIFIKNLNTFKLEPVAKWLEGTYFKSILTMLSAVCRIYRCFWFHSCFPVACFFWLGSCGTLLLWMENKRQRQRIRPFRKDFFYYAHSLHLCCSVIIWTLNLLQPSLHFWLVDSFSSYAPFYLICCTSFPGLPFYLIWFITVTIVYFTSFQHLSCLPFLLITYWITLFVVP